MFLLSNIYFLGTIIIFLSLLACLILTAVRKSAASKIIIKLEVTTLLAILFCSSFYLVKNHTVAYIFWCIYLILLDIDSFYILQYVMIMTDSVNKKNSAKILQIIYSVFVFFDAVMIVTSLDTGIAFSIVPVTIDDTFTTWIVSFNAMFYVHLLFCYLISLATCVIIVRKIIQGAKTERPNYIKLFIIFFIILLTNGIFIIISDQIIYDFSSIIYGFLLIYVYNFTFYAIPNYLQKNLILINSENLTDAIICFDEKGKFVYANKIARSFFSNTNHEQKWAEKFLNGENDYFWRTEKVELNGELRSFKVEFRRLRDSKNRISGSYIKLNDCTNEIVSMEKEAYRASHDELTGLFNRDFFFREMTRILKNEPDVPRYLVCTDIKDFKLVNELFGSDFGDRLLVRQAEMLKLANYPGVIWGRIFGDRYAMLIKKSDFNPELAVKNTDKITEMEKEINFKLTVYIGIYEITDPTENVHTMYDKANLAIKNIQPGLNQKLFFYDTNLMNSLLMEKTIVNEFDDALSLKQFEMYLQPQIEVKTGLCAGAEALVRWNHPEKGCVPPFQFIKALEKSDQIYKLDFYVWNLAAQKLAEWKKAGIDKYISVNISVKDFYYGNLFEHFKQLVEKYDISPEKLNLEITESVVIDDNSIHKNTLKQLQEYGFKIEMDDFGSGYSSLSVLKNIEIDVLKIDMGFLDVSKDENRENQIIASVVKMAKALKMKIISEGVETSAQAEILEKMGVDIFQGYLYSKPIPVQDFEKKYLGGE